MQWETGDHCSVQLANSRSFFAQIARAGDRQLSEEYDDNNVREHNYNEKN
jgi:hypothetical protein